MPANASSSSKCRPVAGLALLLGVALLANEALARGGPDVERWVENDLARYVAGELAGHPRFKDVALRFVVERRN